MDQGKSVVKRKAGRELANEHILQRQLEQFKQNGQTSKENYLKKVEQMLAHIHRGDIYEANFCMEFFSEKATIVPIEIYQKLNTISQPPFAVFFKNNYQKIN